MDYSTMRRKYDYESKKTKYGNRLYYSILEARWAIFFDCLGINHIPVEKQEIVETGMREYAYKPDFDLPELQRYVEIKPTKPIDVENSKAAGWAKDIGSVIILFNLNPPTEKSENGWLIWCGDLSPTPIISDSYSWCECPRCGKIDMAELGMPRECGCYTLKEFNNMYEDECEGIEMIHNFHRSLRLLEAYRVAKSYKLENGESKKVSILPKQKTIFTVV